MLNKNKFEKVLKKSSIRTLSAALFAGNHSLDRAILLLVWIRTIKFRT